MWVVSLLSFVIGVVFAYVMMRQYAERRKPYQLLWFISLGMFAAATLAEFWGAAFGWTVPVYKTFYFAGVALPGFFGVGTVYLMTRDKPLIGHVYAALTVLVAAMFLVKVGGAELMVSAAELADQGIAPNHSDIMPVSARRPYSVLLSAVGGMVLIAGALYSWLRFKLDYNRLIALGGVLFVLGGMLASRLSVNFVLPFSNLLGIILIFVGVQQAEKERRPHPSAAAATSS